MGGLWLHSVLSVVLSPITAITQQLLSIEGLNEALSGKYAAEGSLCS